VAGCLHTQPTASSWSAANTPGWVLCRWVSCCSRHGIPLYVQHCLLQVRSSANKGIEALVKSLGQEDAVQHVSRSALLAALLAMCSLHYRSGMAPWVAVAWLHVWRLRALYISCVV
jgi:hypothetical protein